MISKELLNEVFEEDVTRLGSFNSPILEIEVQRYSYKEWLRINIYELAHKCKEWAYTKGYTLASYQSGKDWYICRDPHKTEPYVGADTEPEAIFKACEWIKETT